MDSIDSEPVYLVAPDRKLALKHYIKAADLGEDEACNSVALIIEKENPIDAVNWYKKALEIRETNTDALFNMAMLYLNN